LPKPLPNRDGAFWISTGQIGQYLSRVVRQRSLARGGEFDGGHLIRQSLVLI
jgi:hypothetical protein